MTQRDGARGTARPASPIIEQLRRRRTDRRISARQIERATGMSTTTLHRHEHCKFGALTQLERWADVLGYRLTLVEK
jgi:transcriptional regulator with XRE-family HTH domain